MKVLPQAMATGYIHIGTMTGKLNGVMPATTPSGWRTEEASTPLETSSENSPFSRWGMPQANSTTSMPRATSPRASSSTLPCSAVISRARSSRWRSASSRKANRMRVRAVSEVSRQPGHAASTAPATARSTSASEARTTPPVCSPDAGSNTGAVRGSPPPSREVRSGSLACSCRARALGAPPGAADGTSVIAAAWQNRRAWPKRSHAGDGGCRARCRCRSGPGCGASPNRGRTGVRTSTPCSTPGSSATWAWWSTGGRWWCPPATHAIGDWLFLHGSVASRSLRAARQPVPACVTVTHVDGLVLARSVFEHAVNYRCAMVYGVPEVLVDRDEKLVGLRAISDQVAPGQWEYARSPSAKELAATTVLRMTLDECSVKIRRGPPDDGDGPDAALDVWAGRDPAADGPSRSGGRSGAPCRHRRSRPPVRGRPAPGSTPLRAADAVDTG